MNLSKEDILNRIGFFRNKKNISAYKLGMQLGHSKTYFYRIESGEIQLTLNMLLDILEILDVTTTEFFCPEILKEDLAMYKEIQNLSTENKQVILNLIKKLK